MAFGEQKVAKLVPFVEARTCMGECVWEHVACGAPSRCVGYWLCECRVVPLPAVGLGFDGP